MLDKMDPIKIDEESRENVAIANWAWDSHWWVEYYPGYYKCKWCGTSCTSMTGITKDFPLCKENPAIKKLLEAQPDKVYSPVVGYLSGTNLNLVPCPTCNALCVCTNKK